MPGPSLLNWYDELLKWKTSANLFAFNSTLDAQLQLLFVSPFLSFAPHTFACIRCHQRRLPAKLECEQNLDALHDHLGTLYPGMRAPSFRCSEETDGSLILHYYSDRPGLEHIVIGIVKVSKHHHAERCRCRSSLFGDSIFLCTDLNRQQRHCTRRTNSSNIFSFSIFAFFLLSFLGIVCVCARSIAFRRTKTNVSQGGRIKASWCRSWNKRCQAERRTAVWWQWFSK